MILCDDAQRAAIALDHLGLWMRSDLFKLLALSLTAFSMAGCAEEWVKPGASPAQFEAAEAQCLSDAYARFPPAETRELVSDAYYTAPEKRCDSNGNNCYRKPPQYVPAHYQIRDTNNPPRTANVRNCLFRKGWTPKQ
jgi:hypothetical protein